MRSMDLGQAAHLIAADPATLDDPALRDRIADLTRLANHTYAQTLSAVDAFDRRGLCGGDGFKTTKAWLAGYLAITDTQADRLVAAMRLLR